MSTILKKVFFVLALLATIFVWGWITLKLPEESDYGLFAHFTVVGFIRLVIWIALIVVVPILYKKIFNKRPPN
jgi:hypothetical protein